MKEQCVRILRQQFTIFPKVEYIKEIFEDSQDGRQCAYIMRISRGADVRIDTVMDPDGQFRLQAPVASAHMCRREYETLLGVVNADFFNMTNGIPQGPVVMSGHVIKEEMPDNTFFFGIRRDGTAVIGDKTEFLKNKQALQMAVGGRHLLIDGDSFPEAMLEPKSGCHPRTAVCICGNGDLLLAVLDGRNPGTAEGLQLDRFARYLKSLGAEKALNLDGGGSSVMALRGMGQTEIGIVSTPSDGYERVCANGIALFAQQRGNDVCHSVCILPQQEYVAPGTRLKLTACGLDQLLNVCALPEGIRFSVPQDSGCSVSDDGIFHAAPTDCDVTVSVSAGERLLGTALLQIRTPDALHVPKDCICTEGEVHELGVTATLKGRRVLTNSTSYHFQVQSDIGCFDETGRFHAKHAQCEGGVRVCTKNNGPAAGFHVRVGRLPERIDVSPGEMQTTGCSVSTHRPLFFSPRRGQQVYQVDCLQSQSRLWFDAPIRKKPKALGMWVHTIEGTLPAFALTVQSGAPAAFVQGEPTDTVWTYLEAPILSDVPLSETMKIALSVTGAQGTCFAVDSFRLVYDYVNDDLQTPEIRQIVIKKYANTADERIKITAYLGVGDLLPCYVPVDYKRLRILVDEKEYTGVPGHYGVNKGAASLMLHNLSVSRGVHRVSVCAQTCGGKQTWKEITFDTDQLETT